VLLEREEPLKQLLWLSERALQGRGGIALVGGEAGVGKTTLLEAMRNQLPKRCKVLWGGCDALFTPRPLGPLHDMAAGLSEKIREQLSRGVQSSQLYTAILEDIENTPGGTVLVFEDTHWADYATLDLIKFIGRRISLLSALLIISFRNDEVGDNHPLTRVLGELPSSHTSRVDLQNLSIEAVETLGVPPGYSIDDLYSITGGNPFFVTELLEYRHTPGAIIPASVKDAVAARLTNLSTAERILLETIAVMPGTIPIKVLAFLFPENGETLAMACVGRNLLILDGNDGIKFRHELARLANLARISNNKKKELHGRVLEALLAHATATQTTPPYDQLVHHAAGAFMSRRVLEFAPQAAKIAASVGAHSEAAAHLASALQFVNEADSEVAAQLYEDWAYEAGLALRIDDEVLEARRHAITLWRALNRPEKVGENLRFLSRLHSFRGEASEADHYADEAIRVIESTPQSAQHAMAYSLRSQLHMLNDRMDEAIRWGLKALDLADQYQNIEVKTHALNNIGSAKAFRGNTEGVQDLQLSLELALKAGLHEHAARVYTNLSEYGVEFCDFKLAESTLANGIAFNTQHDLFTLSNYLLGRQALLRLEQGRLLDAETIASGILKSEHLPLLARLPALSVLAAAQLRLGYSQAYDTLSQALTSALAMDEFQYIVPIRLVLIESAWLDDNLVNAKEHLIHLEEVGGSNMHCWRRGATALWAHRLSYPLPDSFQDNIPPPHQLELQGKHFEAAQQWQELGLPYSAAVTLMQTSEEALIPDALTKAQGILESINAHKALAKLRKLAATYKISEQLPRARRGPYKAARNHPLGLTKREQQILALITNGATNKEISETLSRSQRTVEHHVSSILAKLNAASRMEAMLRVHNEPWLLPKEFKAGNY
jgi:DNA-binding NarL/FixJ family response regulator